MENNNDYNITLYASNHQPSSLGGDGGGLRGSRGPSGSVSTIGSFDGVHRGHQYVVQQVMERARALGLRSMVVTFPNHPLKVLRPDFKAQLLSTAEEKTELLQATGVDTIAMIPFTEALSQLTAREFMQHILKEQLNVRVLVIGYDNHFGHDHKSFLDYVEYGKELGIEVVHNNELPGEEKVSSTTIRNALMEGDTDTATRVLGHPYYIRGKVVSGFHIGRKIGFPTANIEVDTDKLIPADGAYCVRAEGYGYGMMNIGHRPTLDNGPQRSIEVHLFDCDADLYGEQLKLEFVQFLRPERKFETIDELIAQLERDKKECRKYC